MNQLKKKNSLYFFVSLTCFSWASSLCFALPSVPVAQSGAVEVEYPDSHTMVIKSSDGAILQYEDFQIGFGEEVHVLSKAQHHVIGDIPSQISGALTSNGDIILINPKGISLGSTSQVRAPKIHVDASKISVQGSLDSTNAQGKGGSVHLFGKDVSLQGAKIDVSGLTGGGEVLVGGEFQGQGTTPYASKVLMDEPSEIYADAIENGDGGLVVLWSQDHTLFDGKISAQGGVLGGNGGLVETSSRGSLDIGKGKVNTLDAKGQAGEWLLDPYYLTIVPGDANDCGYGNCDYYPGNCYFGANHFFNLTSNLTLRSIIYFSVITDVNITSAIPGFVPIITFENCPSYGDAWFIFGDGKKTYTINANRAQLVFSGIPTVFVYGTVNINTGGSNLDLKNIAGNDASSFLTVDVGGGNLTVSTYPIDTSPGIGSLIINRASSVTTERISVLNDFRVSNAPLFVKGNETVNITSKQGSISVESVNPVPGDSSQLNLGIGNSSTLTAGPVGNSNSFRGFSVVGGSIANLSSVTTTDGGISISPSVVLSGDLATNGSIFIGGSLSINGNVSLKSLNGISINAQVETTGATEYDLALDASTTGSISLGGDVSNLRSFTIMHAGQLSMFGITTLGGAINIACPNVIKNVGSIKSNGGDIAFSGTIHPTDHNIGGSLAIDAGSGSVSVQEMGDLTYYFGGISLIGGSVTLGSNINASGTITIDNTDLLMVSTSTMNVGGFKQVGSGAVSLEGSINTAGPISFAGALRITGNTTLQGSKGLTLPSAIIPNSANCNLSLNAGSNSLKIKSLGSETAPFGALSITASTLDLEGDLYSSSFVKIEAPITISADCKISSAGASGIVLTKPVTVAAGSLAPMLILNATSAGAVDVNNLGNDAAPLGAVALTGNHVYLSGNIASSASVAISGPITIFAPITLRGDTGITLDEDVSSNAGSVDLTLLASNGTISVKNLGTDIGALNNISIISTGPIEPGKLICIGGIDLRGTTITLGSNVTASTYLKMNNTDLLTISSSNLNLIGDFIQSGTGNVSLGASITTSGLISFTGALSITGSTTLKGDKGITITDSIGPQAGTPNLTLNAGTNPLMVNFLSSKTNPFGSVTVSASSLILGGDVYASSAIKINPPIMISANTTFSSLEGTGGITLVKPVTVATGSGAPTLTLYAAGGAANVNSLGSDAAPLGDVSLVGSTVFLSGNITSNAGLQITGPVYLLNDNSISLTGDASITLANSLIPNAGLCNLIMQSIGVVKTQDLGNSSYPLDEVFLTGSSIELQGTITAQSLTINGATCSSGSCSSGTYTTCPVAISEKQSR